MAGGWFGGAENRVSEKRRETGSGDRREEGGRGCSDNLTKLKAAAASERQEKEPDEEEIGPGSGWC